LAVFFLLVLGLLLVYRFLVVGGGRAPVRAPVNVSVATSAGNVSVVDSDGDGIPDDLEGVSAREYFGKSVFKSLLLLIIFSQLVLFVLVLFFTRELAFLGLDI